MPSGDQSAEPIEGAAGNWISEAVFQAAGKSSVLLGPVSSDSSFGSANSHFIPVCHQIRVLKGTAMEPLIEERTEGRRTKKYLDIRKKSVSRPFWIMAGFAQDQPEGVWELIISDEGLM